MKKPIAEFERRAECFINAYYRFKDTGRTGNLFPSLYHLISFCIYRSTDEFIKEVKL